MKNWCQGVLLFLAKGRPHNEELHHPNDTTHFAGSKYVFCFGLIEGSKALITGNHRCQWLANYCITVYTDILLSKNDNGTNIGQGIVFFSGLENAKKKEHIGTAPHFEKENAMPKFLRGSSPTPTNVWAKNLDRSFFWLRQTVFKKTYPLLKHPYKYIYIYIIPTRSLPFCFEILQKKN